jgi:tetratricopeptide (TPR) repeat protein
MTTENTLTIALQHYQRNEFEQAESLYRQIIEQPSFPVEVLDLLAKLIYETGKAFDLVVAYNMLGQELLAQGKLDAASVCCQQALQIKPDDVVAYHNLGNVLQRQNQLEAAFNCYQQVLQIQPDYVAAHLNIGHLFSIQHQYDAALVCYQQVLRLQPDNMIAYNNLGSLLYEQNRLDAALECYQTALRLQPNHAGMHESHAMLLLKLGCFPEGWLEYEWRRPAEVTNCQSPLPQWDGTPLAGRRLLIHWEQGFGDTIQFIRYLPLIKGGTIILACQASLATLCQGVTGIDKLIVEQPAAEYLVSNEVFDVWIQLMSLPRIFATTLDTIPAAIPYLFPELNKVANWHPRFNPKRLNIGLVWAGRPSHKNDNKRSCPLEQFAPLANLPNVAFFSLQAGEAAAQPVPTGLTLTSLSEELTDFSDTAAVIACLDLVISVDTAVAHLAGALGKPVWVLLPFAAEWRWLTDREDSPWYPTMRLFRQPQPGDWDSVFAQVANELSRQREMLQALRWSNPTAAPSSPQALAELYNEAGNRFRTQNQLEMAMECYQRALRIHPMVETYNNLGGLYFAYQRLEEAKECCQQAIRLQPDAAEAYYNLGIVLQAQNQLKSAFESYQQAVHQKPDYVAAYQGMVTILEAQLKQETTLADSELNSSLQLQLAEVYYQLGVVYQQQKQPEIASEYYQKALLLAPNDADARNNLGSIWFEQRQLEAAFNCYQQLLEMNPNLASIYNNLGSVLYAQNQVAAALEHYHQALRLQPDYAEVYVNLSLVSADDKQLEVALEYCDRAIRLQPKLANAHFNRALILLKLGRFQEGWQEYEWREQAGVIHFQSPYPQWDGTPLAGRRLLVLWEQGFGDMIQFVRYLPFLKGGTVILLCRPALATLFQGVAGIDELVIADRSTIIETIFDVWIHLMSLPRLFAMTLDNIPATIPYLYPDFQKVATWRQRFNPQQLNIGIVWAGSPTYKGDYHRSCTVAHFAPLANIPNVAFFSLQKGETASQPVPAGLLLTSLSEELNDFSDTAAVIACLDLIIAVDTAVAHLAGALGKPVWVLLPFTSDWRWLTDRDDSPWYPTMRLFRQPRRGDWDSVFAQVANELPRQREMFQALRWSHLNASPSSSSELAQIYHEAGNLFRTQPQLETAIECYQRALRIQPTAETYNNLGGLYFAQQQLEEAKECCQQALRLQPEVAESYHNLGVIFQQQNQLEAAVEVYQQAVRLKPDYAAYYNLGVVFQEQKQLETAIEYYQKALHLQPNYADAYNNLGNCFFEQKQLDAAITCYQQLLSINPHDANVYNSRGSVLYAQNQVEAAIESYYQALRLQPDNAEVYLNLSIAFLGKNQLAVALEYCQHALRLQPKLARTHIAYAEILLTMADFHQGWEEYEWRLGNSQEKHEFPSLNKPPWDGTPLAGRQLLVHWEQGFGDTIQFVRYLPLIKGGTVIWACPPGLEGLCRTMTSVDVLISRPFPFSPPEPEIAYDVWIALMSLPKIFATTLDRIPTAVPYLLPESSKVAHWRECFAPNLFKVGIVWAGNPAHVDDHRRSCALAYFAALVIEARINY